MTTDPREPIDYASTQVPSGYRCQYCGAQGVKLWRDYQMLLCHIQLSCLDCSGKQQKRDVSTVDAEGRVLDQTVGVRSDAIGWLVPAVPTETNDNFWGYTSVPEPAVQWWRRLPSRPSE